jgi:hypothetical protein
VPHRLKVPRRLKVPHPNLAFLARLRWGLERLKGTPPPNFAT